MQHNKGGMKDKFFSLTSLVFYCTLTFYFLPVVYFHFGWLETVFPLFHLNFANLKINKASSSSP